MVSALPSRRRTLGALALTAFAYLYAFPYQPRINNPNENVRLYMTAALVEQGTYVIDDFRERWGWVNDCAVRDGHAYSVKAPATSFMGVPFYWMYLHGAEAMGHEFDRTEALWVCRVFASILPWLLFLVWFHRWLGRHTGSPLLRDAVFFSVALGSCLYGYGMLFMSHTLSAGAAFGGFMLLFHARRAGRIRPMRAFWAGVLVAGVSLLEYPGFFASAVLAVYGMVVLRPLSRWVPFALGGAIPTAAMMHFQWKCFGSPFSPGHLYVENDFFRGRHEEGFFGAVGLQWEALYGLLVDPGAGLFPLTPILVFALLGLGLLLAKRFWRADGVTVLLVTLLTLAGIAVMNNWRGGWTIGPRYLVLVYPFLAWAALLGLDAIAKKAPRTAAGLAVGTTAVGLLLSGAPSLYYPHLPPEVTRPVTQLVTVLWSHDYAPFTLANRFDLYGTVTMIPLVLAAGGAMAFVVHAAPTGRDRLAATLIGTLVAALVAAPLLYDPEPGAEPVQRAVALITGTWTPAGQDRASRLADQLRTTPDPAGYRELAALYETEGRHAESARAERRASQLDRTLP
ncbi:MAG: hypothetical protein AB8I08_17455 [Sandaracinaceae bacterium]